tara:strand:- start:1756 stop:2247 length:492 start_codon:yes stop_codon:yes gene_type:complete
MAGQPITRKQMALLDKAGEFAIFEFISEGGNVTELKKKFGVGNRAFYKWLKKEPNRHQKYKEAQKEKANYLAESCLQISDSSDQSNYNANRLKIDTRKWIAGQLNEKWSDKKSPLVEISIQNQHLDAVRELKDLIVEPEKIESSSLKESINGSSSEDYEEEKL